MILIATSTPTAPAVVVVVTPPPPSATATEMAPPTAEPTAQPLVPQPANTPPTSAPPTTGPSQPTVQPTADLPKGGSLLKDALSGNYLGWHEGGSAESGGSYAFEGNQYHIRIAVTGTQAIGVPSPDQPDQWRFGDFIYQVDATLIEGPGGQAYGLVFRYQDADNYYLFEIGLLGNFQCVKVFQGARTILIRWTDHPAIRPGYDTNHLGVMARGSELSFYANGVQVASLSDGDLAEGKVGLTVVTDANGPVHASFANLEVWAVR